MKNTMFRFISCLLCAAIMASVIIPVSFATYDDGIYVQYVFSTYLEPSDEKSTLAVDAYGNTIVTGTIMR